MKTPIYRMRSILNELAREGKSIDDEILELEKNLNEKYAEREDD